MDVEVELHCAACGSAHYAWPAAPEAPIRCNDCGQPLGTVAELQAEMLAQAKAGSAEAKRAGIERLG